MSSAASQTPRASLSLRVAALLTSRSNQIAPGRRDSPCTPRKSPQHHYIKKVTRGLFHHPYSTNRSRASPSRTGLVLPSIQNRRDVRKSRRNPVARHALPDRSPRRRRRLGERQEPPPLLRGAARGRPPAPPGRPLSLPRGTRCTYVSLARAGACGAMCGPARLHAYWNKTRVRKFFGQSLKYASLTKSKTLLK